VDGIKNMSIEYEVRVASEKKEEKDKKQEFKFETAKAWSEEQIKKFKRNLPNIVTTTISFWDLKKKRSKQFTLKTVIVEDEAQPRKSHSTGPSTSSGHSSGQAASPKKPDNTPRPPRPPRPAGQAGRKG